MLLLVSMSAVAQAQTCLVLQLRDGSKQSFVLEEKPEVTFGNQKVRVSTAKVETAVAMTEVQDFHFAEAESGIPAMMADECRMSYAAGVVTLCGYEGTVTLTDVDGRRLRSVQAKAGQSVTLDLSQEAGRVFLLQMGRRSVKLMK